jgi:hypothetical protein
VYANARNVLDHARADLDQALPDRRELSLGQQARLRDRGAYAMHQPERRGVEDEPHLIGGRERRIAGEAENIVGAVVLRPFHRLDATVMTVAAPRCGCSANVASAAWSHA